MTSREKHLEGITAEALEEFKENSREQFIRFASTTNGSRYIKLGVNLKGEYGVQVGEKTILYKMGAKAHSSALLWVG